MYNIQILNERDSSLLVRSVDSYRLEKLMINSEMLLALEVDSPVGKKNILLSFFNHDKGVCLFFEEECDEELFYRILRFIFEKFGVQKIRFNFVGREVGFIKLCYKFGFVREGVLEKDYITPSGCFDVLLWVLTEKSWMTLNQKNNDKTESYFGNVYEKQVFINADLVQQFAQVSDDFNPIHFDQHAAQQAGFRHQIAHGLLSVSFFSGIFGTQIDPQGLVYLSQSAEFFRPVYLDTQVTVRVEIIAHIGRQITAQTSVWQGEDRLLSGVAKLLLPKHSPSAALPA